MAGSIEEALIDADEREYITANYSTEELILPETYEVIGVKGDENSRRAWFKLIRIPDELDLTTGVMHVVYINAQNQNGVYAVDDRTLDEDGNVVFSWLLSPNVCISSGKITFALCGYSNGVEWHTQPATALIGKYVDGALCADVDEDDPEDFNRYLQMAEMVSVLQADMTTAQTNISLLQTDLGTAQSDIGALQTEVSDAQSDITELQSDVDVLQSDTASLKSNMITAQSNISTLQNDLSAAQSDIGELQTNVDGAKTDINALKSNMTDAQNAISTLQSDVTDVQDDISNLRDDMSTAQNDIITLQTDVGVAQSAISTLRSDMSTAQSNISTLQTDMSNAQSDIGALRSEMTDAQSDISVLQSEVSSAQRDIDELQDSDACNTLRLDNIETALITHTELATALVDATGTMVDVDDGAVLGAEDTLYQEATDYTSYLSSELDAARMRIRVLEADQTSANADISDINASLDDMQTSVSAIEGTSVNMQNDISALQDTDSISTQRLDNIEVAMLTHTELSAALIDASGTMLETSAGYVLGADDSLPDAQQDYCDYLRDELDSARMRIRTLESAVMALQATVSALTA